MSTCRRTRLVAAWVASLVAVGAIAMGQTRPTIPLAEPAILSGADVGFRIEGRQGSTPVGHIVVRIDGKWVEAAVGGEWGLQPIR